MENLFNNLMLKKISSTEKGNESAERKSAPVNEYHRL
jgi:hypothetical protein